MNGSKCPVSEQSRADRKRDCAYKLDCHSLRVEKVGSCHNEEVEVFEVRPWDQRSVHENTFEDDPE